MQSCRRVWVSRTFTGLLFAGGVLCLAAPQGSGHGVSMDPQPRAVIDQYCIACHNDGLKTAGLSLSSAGADDPGDNPDVWEKVVRRLRARRMPPPGLPRPDDATYDAVTASLEASLDRAAAAHPNPGRTDTFRRLNRTEYHNAVRDLLAVDVDVASLLPTDESSHGFDNVTVGDLSPTLLDRYIAAAEKISRLAVGRPSRSPGGQTIRTPPDLTQEEHIEGLPVGTRGGVVFPYTFPLDGEYEFTIRLTRDRNEDIEGLREPHDIELLVDNKRVELFTVEPPRGENPPAADEHLKIRLPIEAGPHEVGATFLRKSSALLETERQPYQAHFNYYRHPRITPAVYSVSIVGPYDAEGPGETPSRQRIFVCQPRQASEEEGCAQRILETLMRRAYRRPVTAADLERPLQFYRETRAKDGFEAGVEMALRAVLVSPEFLFRVEQDPADVAPKTAYRISDLELASRLSFFLWSSIPDDELLETAIEGRLHEPAVLEKQVRRLLADERSQALVTNFASQWLYLRNLESITPDMRLFPDFDDNLRQAFREETELFFQSIVREDRSVLDLLHADYTFMNERLAKHYGIPNIYGSRFRRISLDKDSKRGGLLRQGSILMVTSYATRTSPVIRGKWVLGNLLGMPPPPPLPNVPALEQTIGTGLSMRERLARHRADPVCASCHKLMDPIGFSLENYDAVGRWRTTEEGKPIDASGGLPDGSEFEGIDGLEHALLSRPELFAGTLTEKLLTYALGRGVETYDAPAVRGILGKARAENFRFSSLIVGIADSTPFQMRRSR
jgi:Protein of unknown function (DUF1592)/Protein of unknown function (DUF1588)/Protein of unknown function (DUF1587)/Protein of unknown function (DUF1585)/Protein of unknown function (DUF1595)/Cytochrome C oxidase, cbb3-type, subunit III